MIDPFRILDEAPDEPDPPLERETAVRRYLLKVEAEIEYQQERIRQLTEENARLRAENVTLKRSLPAIAASSADGEVEP